MDGTGDIDQELASFPDPITEALTLIENAAPEMVREMLAIIRNENTKVKDKISAAKLLLERKLPSLASVKAETTQSINIVIVSAQEQAKEVIAARKQKELDFRRQQFEDRIVEGELAVPTTEGF